MTQYKLSNRKLRKIRQENGITLEQIGEFTGIDFSTIGKIERGERTFTIKQAHKFAEALGVNVHAFFE